MNRQITKLIFQNLTEQKRTLINQDKNRDYIFQLLLMIREFLKESKLNCQFLQSDCKNSLIQLPNNNSNLLKFELINKQIQNGFFRRTKNFNSKNQISLNLTQVNLFMQKFDYQDIIYQYTHHFVLDYDYDQIAYLIFYQNGKRILQDLIFNKITTESKKEKEKRKLIKGSREMTPDVNLIMTNILYLASFYTKGNQRNLLNKWFQDSVKNYVLESIASPLLAKYLNCNNTKKVKDFIEKNIDKSKPKYMSLMEQYFIQIQKFDLGCAFKERINEILQNPINSQVQQFSHTYNNEKAIRKQFVCYLVFRYFELFSSQVFPSFYELWNYCFPQEIQIKKKLSRYDFKISKRKPKMLIKENIHNSQNSYVCSDGLLNSTTFVQVSHRNICFNSESSSNITQAMKKNFEKTSISQQSQFNYQEDNYITDNIKYPQKKEINNHIFEEDDNEEEEQVQIIRASQTPNYQQTDILYDQHCYFLTQSQSTQQAENLIYFENQQYYSPLYQANENQIFTLHSQND